MAWLDTFRIARRKMFNIIRVLWIRKMQIKTTLRYCYTLIRMAKMEKANKSKSGQVCETTRSLLYCLGGGGQVTGYSYLGKECGSYL